MDIRILDSRDSQLERIFGISLSDARAYVSLLSEFGLYVDDTYYSPYEVKISGNLISIYVA